MSIVTLQRQVNAHSRVRSLGVARSRQLLPSPLGDENTMAIRVIPLTQAIQ
jgi:hypothetical protein